MDVPVAPPKVAHGVHPSLIPSRAKEKSGHLQRCPPCDEFAVQAAVHVLSMPALADQRVIGVNRVHVATHLFKLSWQPLTLSS